VASLKFNPCMWNGSNNFLLQNALAWHRSTHLFKTMYYKESYKNLHFCEMLSRVYPVVLQKLSENNVSYVVCQQVALSFLKAIGGGDDIDGLCDSD